MTRLRVRARNLKSDIFTVYLAARDPETGILPKLIALCAIAYALSPVDLIPDFIPVLGYLDDLILLPALIALAIRLIPPPVLERARQQAQSRGFSLKKNWIAGTIIIFIWLLIVFLLIRIIWRRK